MSIYTYRQLKQLEQEFNSTRQYFYDVVFQEKGGNKADDLFKESDAYSSYSYFNEEKARATAARMAERYANNEKVSVHIRVWSCLNNEFHTEGIIIVKESKYFDIKK